MSENTRAIRFPRAKGNRVTPSLIIRPRFPRVHKANVNVLRPRRFPSAIRDRMVKEVFFYSADHDVYQLVNGVINIRQDAIRNVCFEILPFDRKLYTYNGNGDHGRSNGRVFLRNG